MYRRRKDTSTQRRILISESGLREVRRVEGLSRRDHTISPEDVEKTVYLCEGGLTITWVITEVGYSHGTIRTAHLKHGVAI